MGSPTERSKRIAPGKLQAADLPIAEPPQGHVRVRVQACGVCHSDAVTVEGGPGLTYPRMTGLNSQLKLNSFPRS